HADLRFQALDVLAALADQAADLVLLHEQFGLVVGQDLHANVAGGPALDDLQQLVLGQALAAPFFAGSATLQRHDDDLFPVRVDLEDLLPGPEIRDHDDGPRQVGLRHAAGHAHGELHLQDLLDLALLHVDDRVDDLGDHAQFDATDQPLHRVDGAVGVRDADEAHAGQAHVPERDEIAGLAHLVVDDVIGTHQ